MSEKKKHIEHQSGFKVPKGYFNNLNNRLLNTLDMNDNNSIIPEKSGFTTPKDYFKSFTIDTEQLDKENNNSNSKIISLNNKKLIYSLSIAASLVLLIAIVLPKNNNDTITFESLNTTAFNDYIDTEHEALDTYMIAEVFNDEIEDLNLISNDEVIDESLIDYLDNEDTSYLIEEL